MKPLLRRFGPYGWRLGGIPVWCAPFAFRDSANFLLAVVIDSHAIWISFARFAVGISYGTIWRKP